MAEPGTFSSALLGRCPRCGKGHLFDGYLKIAPACTACGLDYSDLDAGDGPAVFVILIVGFITAGGALITEVQFSPPFWVQAAIWFPVVVVLSILFLRLAKALLLVLQFKHRAGEGQRID